MDCKLRTQNCGGCPMLSIEYAEQLKKKESAVRALLGKYGPVARRERSESIEKSVSSVKEIPRFSRCESP